jgi:hypothetical protein
MRNWSVSRASVFCLEELEIAISDGEEIINQMMD